MTDDYKQTLQKARKDLNIALQQRAELDTRITGLKQTIQGLSVLSGEHQGGTDQIEDLVDSFIEATGISNGIRRVLSKAPAPMSAPEIRDALLKKTEYKLVIEGYANPLSVIHNTLVRLIRQGEVVQNASGFLLKEK